MHRITSGKRERYRPYLFAALFGVFAFLAAGCGPQFGPGRGAPSLGDNSPKKRDFGLELYKILLREAALHPKLSRQRTEALKALNDTWDIPAVFNYIFTPSVLPKFDLLMRGLLPFYDDGTLPQLTRELSDIIKNEIVPDRELLSALMLLSQRQNHYPPLLRGEQSVLVRPFTFRRSRELLSALTSWWIERDGFDDWGNVKIAREKPIVGNFLRRAGDWLLRVNKTRGKGQPSLLLDILLTEDPRLDLKQRGKRCFVRFDADGNPLLTAAGKQAFSRGKLPPPFPSEKGVKVGPCGEAVSDAGRPLYQVRDLGHSVLGSLFWDLRGLIEKELKNLSKELTFPFNLLLGVRPLFGRPYPDGKLSLRSPFFSTFRTLLPILKSTKIPKILELVGILAEKHSSELAAQLALMNTLADLAEKFPPEIGKNTKLLKELWPFFQKIASNPQLVKDLLELLKDKDYTKRLLNSLIPLMKYKYKRITPQVYAAAKAKKVNIFTTPVDRKSPETAENVSLVQRILHLLANVNRWTYRSQLKTRGNISIPFIEMRIDNLALFYIRAVADDLSIWEAIYVNGKPIQDGVLKDQLRKGLKAMGLSERPDPEELVFLLNREMKYDNVPLIGPITMTVYMEKIICREGYEVRFHHGDSLFAALLSGLVAKDGGALRPIAKVFNKHKMLPMILDLFTVLDKHWPSEDNVDRTKAGKETYPRPRTNLRSAEPLLIESIGKTDIIERLSALARIISSVRLSGGVEPIEPLQQFAAFLIGPPGKPKDITPLGKLFSQLEKVRDVMDKPENKKYREALTSGMKALWDLAAQVEGSGASAKFKNPRAPVVLEIVSKKLSREIESRQKKGQWSPELSRFQRDLEENLSDPVISALFELIEDFSSDKYLVRIVSDFFLHLIADPDREPDRFGELLTLTAMVLSPQPDAIKVPIAHFLGRILKYRAGFLTGNISLVKRLTALDRDLVVQKLLLKAFTAHQKLNAYRGTVFWEIIKLFHRKQPESRKALSEGDYRQIFLKISAFLVDSKRGLEKFYKIVRQRNGPLKK